MGVVESLKIVAGIIILISSMTILVMVFMPSELNALAVLFNFGIDVTASNLAEAIVYSITAALAGLFFILGMLIIGVIYLAASVTFGVLTLVLKRSKAITIIVLILASFTLIIGIRAVVFLSIAGYSSLVLPLRIVADSIVITICIYSLVILFRKPSEIK
ncbi:MAG: hypothetical protein ACFFDX_05835 [Candidatus Odinarchaeota archaeon]